jgi:hypothetical protein
VSDFTGVVFFYLWKAFTMCRNIRPLFNFEPPATEEEARNAAVQFVRKISGFAKPSHANEEAFYRAVDEVTASTRALIASLTTAAAPRDRKHVADRAKARAAQRYGQSRPERSA